MSKWGECLENLLHGNYDEWWPRHEWIRSGRADTKDRFELTPTYGKPVWDGKQEEITLLVNADFGMGDTIHFWRFIPAARNRVARLFLRCDEDFFGLFCMNGVELVGKDDQLPEFDKIIHMMALPRALGVKKADIDGKPYLQPNPYNPPQHAMTLMRHMKFFKIGMCWAGNPFNPRDFLRSIPTDLLSILFVIDGMRIFNLTKIDNSFPVGFIDMRGYMRDWNETAHLLTYMDLVISVDTAIAHLAGALGRPVWMLTPNQDPDWRWGLEGDKTIWYDSMRLFRRKSDWSETLNRVAVALRELAESFDQQEQNHSVA
jgi:hypothetical protein